jgi:ketosteroid isomerase-like protein
MTPIRESAMTDRRQELLALTDQFVDAFNRMNLDDVVSFFSEDAVYEDSAGSRHVGHEAIRTAFEPLVGGSRGRIRFDGEDVFAEVETGKVLASWRLNLDKDGDVSVIRGIDVLEFQGNKLAKKLAYMKVDKPHLEAD